MRIEDKYRLEARIGEGAQSTVYTGISRRNGMTVAIKQIKPTPMLNEERDDIIPVSKLAANYREIAILQRLREGGSHTNIVELIEVVFDERTVFIVMNHCGMNLSEYILRRRSHCVDALFAPRPKSAACASRPVVPLDEIKTIMWQVFSALEFIHAQLVVHRDLKPQNIFVSKTQRGDLLVRVGDFGLAKAFTFPVAPETVNVASLWYRSPEVLLQTGYDLGCDLWPMGCILAELASGTPLFIETCEFGLLMRIFQTLGTPDRDCWNVLERTSNFSLKWPKWNRQDCLPCLTIPMSRLLGDRGCDLLLALLAYESNDRLRAGEALSHSFFTVKGYVRLVEEETGDLSDQLSDLSV